MAELHISSGMMHHFSQRLRQYLLFLEFTNDQELLQIFLSFLDLSELLRFLGTSSHFYSLKKLQSVEVRILRGKIIYYEKPKPVVGFDPFAHLLPARFSEANPKKAQKMKEQHKSLLKFNREIRLTKSLMKAAATGDREQFQKIAQRRGFSDFHKEDQQLSSLLSNSEPQISWSQINKNQIKYFKQFKEQFQDQLNIKLPQNTKVLQYTPRLEAMEYNLAKLDYQRRKMKKRNMKDQQQFIPFDDFKKSADRDPCCREVFNSIYSQQTIKKQQENIAKLSMRPIPSIKQIRFDKPKSEVKVVKQSLAGKMYSGIKSMFFKMQGL